MKPSITRRDKSSTRYQWKQTNRFTKTPLFRKSFFISLNFNNERGRPVNTHRYRRRPWHDQFHVSSMSSIKRKTYQAQTRMHHLASLHTHCIKYSDCDQSGLIACDFRIRSTDFFIDSEFSSLIILIMIISPFVFHRASESHLELVFFINIKKNLNLICGLRLIAWSCRGRFTHT